MSTATHNRGGPVVGRIVSDGTRRGARGFKLCRTMRTHQPPPTTIQILSPTSHSVTIGHPREFLGPVAPAGEWVTGSGVTLRGRNPHAGSPTSTSMAWVGPATTTPPTRDPHWNWTKLKYLERRRLSGAGPRSGGTVIVARVALRPFCAAPGTADPGGGTPAECASSVPERLASCG